MWLAFSFSSVAALAAVCVLLFVVVLALGLSFRRSRSRFPSGPFCIPFIGPLPIAPPKGSAPDLSPDERPFFQKLSDYSIVHGDIYGITFAGRTAVVVSNLKMLKYLWQDLGDAVTGRINIAMLDFINPKQLGLLCCEGARWKEQRRFALHTLRNYGFGKSTSETSIMFELRELIAKLDADAEAGSPVDPQYAVSCAVSNVITVLVFNERLSQDPEFASVHEIMNQAVAKVDLNPIAILLQSYSLWIPFDPFGVKMMLKGFSGGAEYVKKYIAKHRATLDPANPRDYIDAFLIEMNAHANSEEEHFFTDNLIIECTCIHLDEQLVDSVEDLLGAGNETTSTSLRWALLLMAKYPDIQKRVQEEIERAIGGREPVYADKPKMPFTESVMNESMRFAAIVPLAPHRVVSPVQIDGYELPVDTYVLGNLYAVQHDPRVWPDPDHFNPEANFPTNVPDDQKEKVAERLEHFIPFSIGKRVCLGETLARQEYFIFFVGLMQRFSISAHPDHPLPSEYIGTHGTTRTPLDYKLVFQRRG